MWLERFTMVLVWKLVTAASAAFSQVGRYERDTLILRKDDLWAKTNLETSQCPNPKACNACFPSAKSG